MRTSVAILLALTTLSSAAQDPPDATVDRTLTVSGPVDLDITTDSGGISVVGGAAGSVRVRMLLKKHRGFRLDSADVERRLRELERNPPIVQNGGTVRLGHVNDRHMLRGISMRFEVETPQDTKLRANADSGGIRVRGIRGRVEVQTDSGGIHVDDVASEVRATADSGGIHIRNVQGPVFAQADSGGIEAVDIAGAIDAQTDSGGIRLAQTTPAPIRAHADSGGATVKLAPSGGYDVDIASDSGRVSIPEMTVRGALSRHRASGKIRGGGSMVDIKVDSGNIHVE